MQVIFKENKTMDLIKIAEEAFATPKKEFDSFGPGDTVTVAYRIKEGNKEGNEKGRYL